VLNSWKTCCPPRRGSRTTNRTTGPTALARWWLGVLLHQRGAVLLAANLELAGAAGVHHVRRTWRSGPRSPVDHVGQTRLPSSICSPLRPHNCGMKGQIVLVASREGLAEVQNGSLLFSNLMSCDFAPLQAASHRGPCAGANFYSPTLTVSAHSWARIESKPLRVCARISASARRTTC